MRITITETYRGERSNGAFIPAGEYDLNDPILCNSAGYFIEHGFATAVGGLPEESAAEEEFNFEAPQEAGAPEAEKVVLGDLTNNELRDLLDKRGVDRSTAKNKAALLALFEDGAE